MSEILWCNTIACIRNTEMLRISMDGDRPARSSEFACIIQEISNYAFEDTSISRDGEIRNTRTSKYAVRIRMLCSSDQLGEERSERNILQVYVGC